MAGWPGSGTVLARQRITEVHRSVSTELIEIDLGDEIISCTPRHRFYTGDWVAAQDLVVGDQLLTAAGQLVFVQRLRRRKAAVPVFNLTVPEQTYFVGANRVLVHAIKQEQAQDQQRRSSR